VSDYEIITKRNKRKLNLRIMDIFFFLKDYMNPVADEDCIKVYMEQIPRGQQKMASECSKSQKRWSPLYNHHHQQTPI
jgi:hypothetical protein